MTLLQKYGYAPVQEEMDNALELISKNIDSVTSKAVLRACFSMMDLTSLKSEDTPESITKFVDKVNSFPTEYPDYPMPASICVFSNFAGVVSSVKKDPKVHTTVVSACFPTSQSFLEVKLVECRMAVESGADEVDVVLPLNSFLMGDYEKCSSELRAIRSAVDEAAQGRHICLKVILETGLLITPDRIAEASFLAMEAGADFIKTSTGKVSVNATPSAAYVMCNCILYYYRATGRKVGFKPAGGISSAKDAVCYYSIVSTILGQEWLNPSLMRFGVSRMANNILSAVEEKTVVFF